MDIVNLESIEIDHIVLFERDNRVFAAGRDKDTRRIRIFLVNEQNGSVYSRNGRTDSWDELYGEGRTEIVNRIFDARDSRRIPVYRLDSYNG
jgi:hypothetical protein